MQTKKVLTCAAVLLLSFGSKAQNGVFNPPGNEIHNQPEKPSFQVTISPVAKSTVFKLSINNPEGKKLNLRISHRVLGAVVDTTINSTFYSCRYNLTEAEDGKYTITVSDRKEEVVKGFELSTTTTRGIELN